MPSGRIIGADDAKGNDSRIHTGLINIQGLHTPAICRKYRLVAVTWERGVFTGNARLIRASRRWSLRIIQFCLSITGLPRGKPLPNLSRISCLIAIDDDIVVAWLGSTSSNVATTLYVGSTTHLELRLKEHTERAGGSYTAKRLPITSVLLRRVPQDRQRGMFLQFARSQRTRLRSPKTVSFLLLVLSSETRKVDRHELGSDRRKLEAVQG